MSFGNLPKDVVKFLFAHFLSVWDLCNVRLTCSFWKECVDHGSAQWVCKARKLDCDLWATRSESLQVRCARAEERLRLFDEGKFSYDPHFTEAKTMHEALTEVGLVPHVAKKCDAEYDFDLKQVHVNLGTCSFSTPCNYPFSVCRFGFHHLLVGDSSSCGTVQVFRIDEASGQVVKIASKSNLVDPQWDTCQIAQLRFPYFAFSSGMTVFCKFSNERSVEVAFAAFNPMHPDPASPYHTSSLGTENIRRMLGGYIVAEHYYEHHHVAFWRFDGREIRYGLGIDLEDVQWIDHDESIVCGDEENIIALHDRNKKILHVIKFNP